MNITIQYFDGCPHWKLADQRVHTVLQRLDRPDVKLAHQLMTPQRQPNALASAARRPSLSTGAIRSRTQISRSV